MSFPAQRPRRLRRTSQLRRLVAETTVSAEDLIYPLFVHTLPDDAPIQSMPGHSRWPAVMAADRAREARELGITAMVLFGIPDVKDASGSGAYAQDGVVQEAIRFIKEREPEMIVIADTC